MFSRFHRTICVAAVLMLGGGLNSLRAQSWNFNDQNKDAVSGPAQLTTSATMVGASIVDIEGYGTGTEVNRVGLTPAGRALSYLEVGVAFSDLELVFSDLSYATSSNIGISFAFRSTEVFSLTDSEVIEFAYSTNGGANFTYAGSEIIAGTDYTPWRVVSFTFDNLPVGQTVNAIRVSTKAAFAGGSSTQYDNIQVVPEPSAVILAGVALTLVVFGYGVRRGRRA